MFSVHHFGTQIYINIYLYMLQIVFEMLDLGVKSYSITCTGLYVSVCVWLSFSHQCVVVLAYKHHPGVVLVGGGASFIHQHSFVGCLTSSSARCRGRYHLLQHWLWTAVLGITFHLTVSAATVKGNGKIR